MGVEYDGSCFRGWQVQEKGIRTVQDCLQKAISGIANQPVSLTCAGRTDARVHAICQVVHFDTETQRPPYAWVMGSNSKLPSDINVLWAKAVPDTFHARFSALARRYRYMILNRPYRSALHRHRAAWCYKPLHAETMAEAASYLRGEHDFSSFRAAGCQARSPRRTVYALTVKRQGDFIVLEIEANAFLHHMVRNIAGVLMAIGSGDRPVQWVQEVLAARNRTLGGVTAPPQGLYLISVRYPAMFALPSEDSTAAPIDLI